MRRLVAAAVLCLAAAPARAEWYADLYGATVSTQARDVAEHIDNGITPIDHTYVDVNDDNVREIGFRVGYWLQRTPWLGTAVDVFHYKINTRQQPADIIVLGNSIPATFRTMKSSVTGIGLDFAVRLQFFQSAEYPDGRLQPYASAGPALFFIDTRDTTHFAPLNQSSNDRAIGAKAGIGLRWQIVPQGSLLAEIRATHYKAEADFISASNAATVHMTSDFRSRHGLIGASFSF